MVTWNNLDALKSYDKLKELKGHVDIKEAMAGENGAKRVAEYTVPMASGLNFNYAAKQVDDEVLNVLAELAEEQQLVDKFEELYNGNGWLRNTLTAKMSLLMVSTNVISMLNSRRKQLTLQTKYMLVRLQTKLVKSSLQLYRSVSVVVI